MGIKENVRAILDELPNTIKLVAATKDRSADEILEAIEAGVEIIGENYVQEAEKKFHTIGRKPKWHFIGHLQKNKVKKAIRFFDMLETIDSFEIAEELGKQCARENKIMPILIEVNSGREKQKFGVLPENVKDLIEKISVLGSIKVMGLMTMGPQIGEPQDSRPYFVNTKKIFDELQTLDLPNVKMQYLSMGMSNSYKVAIEEGANIVRIGTRIFGERR